LEIFRSDFRKYFYGVFGLRERESEMYLSDSH
jgi:hypothetical protein